MRGSDAIYFVVVVVPNKDNVVLWLVSDCTVIELASTSKRDVS